MQHREFILTPIRNIIKEATFNFAALDWGVETYPLIEHYMQSLFLKLTGASEQKLKCICWDIATYDYDYRFQNYYLGKVGGCSSYKDKQKVINDIYDQILKRKSVYNVNTDIDKLKIRNNVINIIDVFAQNSGINVCQGNEYKICKNYLVRIAQGDFLTTYKGDIVLLSDKSSRALHNEKSLKYIYNLVYRHRNRCAHNTLSFQGDQWSLDRYQEEDFRYENYFFRFALIILIDEICMELYNTYLELM